MYMIFLDGFRNARCWHRFFVYGVYIFKSITLVLRTVFDWIDTTLYPETKDWFISHPKQTHIIDNIDRFGWYFVGGIALISIINVLYDPQHQYFIMSTESVCREEGRQKNKSGMLNQSQPGLTPIINQRKTTFGASVGGLSMIGSSGGLVIEVETDDDITSGVHHSLVTDAASTLNSSEIGYRTLLKMDL